MADYKIRITPSFKIDTDLLVLDITESTDVVEGGSVQRRASEVHIIIHQKMRRRRGFNRWLYKVVENELRIVAKSVLVGMARQWADTYEVSLNRVTIKNVNSRWGSCSELNNINLNLWLLLFPKRVVEMVVKHEVTHLTHLNHSKAFYALLNERCGGQLETLNRELKEKIRAYHKEGKECLKKE